MTSLASVSSSSVRVEGLAPDGGGTLQVVGGCVGGSSALGWLSPGWTGLAGVRRSLHVRHCATTPCLAYEHGVLNATSWGWLRCRSSPFVEEDGSWPRIDR